MPLASDSKLQFSVEYVYQPLTEAGDDIVKPLQEGTLLQSGDCYQVRFTFDTLLRGQNDAYVYLFHSDPSGRAIRIDQLNDITTLRNPVKRRKSYVTRCFPVSPPTGRHELYLLASIQPEPVLESATMLLRHLLQQYTTTMDYEKVVSFEYQ